MGNGLGRHSQRPLLPRAATPRAATLMGHHPQYAPLYSVAEHVDSRIHFLEPQHVENFKKWKYISCSSIEAGLTKIIVQLNRIRLTTLILCVNRSWNEEANCWRQ